MPETSSGADVGRIIRELRSLRESAEAADWAVPPEPEWLDPCRQRRLTWVLPTLAPSRDGSAEMSLEELRVGIDERLSQYIAGDGGAVLLVRVPAGIGKTWAAIRAAQWAAAQGLRTLYCAARHDHWATLEAIPGFDPSQWYHWLPIHQSEGEDDPLPETCRHGAAQLLWLHKGYGAYDLCEQLCTHDKHILECPYRLQRQRPEPIVFAMHSHLTTGLRTAAFDVCVVDELPLQAFVANRTVPRAGLAVGATGPLGELTTALRQLAEATAKGRVAGRGLLDRIGPILRDVYGQVDVLPEMLPVVPRVYNAQQVREVPYWYVFDLLRLASPEYDAWRGGWPRWAERVWVEADGLHLLDRALPWKDLPQRVAVLDATGQAAIYETLFGRQVEVYTPRIRRPGRLYQVTHRLNGLSTLVGADGSPTDQARELVGIAGELGRRYAGRVGVITHKRLTPSFELAFGEGNVLHFHALRGSNQLQDVEALIVAGCPSPTISSVIDVATALNPGRVRSFVTADGEGHEHPLWITAQREYHVGADVRLRHGGRVPARGVGGFWADPELQNVYEQLREEELVQAVHRARPNLRECTVWLLTSIPTGEVMDDIWDDPPVAPPGVHWSAWGKLQAWLEARRGCGLSITNADLAQALGLSESWVREQKLLAAIVRSYPDQWELGRIDPAFDAEGSMRQRRGRPVQTAIPRLVDITNYAGCPS